MYGFLISLDSQNQVDFGSGDVFVDVGQVVGLDTVEKDQKRQDAVVSPLFIRCEFIVGSFVIEKRDFFGNPEVFHHQAVKFVGPLVFDVVQVKQVGDIAANHFAVDEGIVSVDVE